MVPVCPEEGGVMPSVGPELAPTKLAWFSFLPRVAGLVVPLGAVGWSSSSLRDARWGLLVAGTPVLLEFLGMAGVPWASPGSHGLMIRWAACREPQCPPRS